MQEFLDRDLKRGYHSYDTIGWDVIEYVDEPLDNNQHTVRHGSFLSTTYMMLNTADVVRSICETG